MKTTIHDDKCYHCGQILTSDARKHLEKIEGLLEKSPEQIEAEEKAEAKRVSDLVDQEVKAKLKENEKSPEQIEAEEEAKEVLLLNHGKQVAAPLEAEKRILRERAERAEKRVQEFADEASAKAKSMNPVSSELKGTAFHKHVHDILAKKFPLDIFVDSNVGIKGGDIEHQIHDDTGEHVATNLIECKDVKTFSQKFIPQLLEDMSLTKSLKAMKGMIFTTKMPSCIIAGAEGGAKNLNLKDKQDIPYVDEKQNYVICPDNDDQMIFTATCMREISLKTSLGLKIQESLSEQPDLFSFFNSVDFKNELNKQARNQQMKKNYRAKALKLIEDTKGAMEDAFECDDLAFSFLRNILQTVPGVEYEKLDDKSEAKLLEVKNSKYN
jgi:hypothetical protein